MIVWGPGVKFGIQFDSEITPDAIVTIACVVQPEPTSQCCLLLIKMKTCDYFAKYMAVSKKNLYPKNTSSQLVLTSNDVISLFPFRYTDILSHTGNRL